MSDLHYLEMIPHSYEGRLAAKAKKLELQADALSAQETPDMKLMEGGAMAVRRYGKANVLIQVIRKDGKCVALILKTAKVIPLYPSCLVPGLPSIPLSLFLALKNAKSPRKVKKQKSKRKSKRKSRS